jgi:type I restriction enzyme S subunit
MYRDTQQVINAALDEVFKTVVVERASEQLASQILHLTSGSRNWSKYSSPSNNGSLFIRAGNVGFACIDLSEIERLSLPPNIDQKRARVNSGDVLVTITGAKVGHCCVVPDNLERAYVNQHVALIRLREKIEPRYLMWFILSPSGGIPQINAMQYGQTKPGLNLTNLRNLSIPIPGKSEQYQIISYLDSIQFEVDKMLKLLAQDTKSLAQLEQSILERAFRGEL